MPGLAAGFLPTFFSQRRCAPLDFSAKPFFGRRHTAVARISGWLRILILGQSLTQVFVLVFESPYLNIQSFYTSVKTGVLDRQFIDGLVETSYFRAELLKILFYVNLLIH